MAGMQWRVGDRGFRILLFLPIVPVGVLGLWAWLQDGIASPVKHAELASLASLALLSVFLVVRGKRLHEDEWVWIAVSLSVAGAGWLGWYAWAHYLAALPATASPSEGDKARLAAHLQTMTALMGLAGNVTLGVGALLGLWLGNRKDRRVMAEAKRLNLTLLQGDINTAIKTLEGDKSFKPDKNSAKLFNDLSKEIRERIDRGNSVPDGIGGKLDTLIDYFGDIESDSWDDKRYTSASDSLDALRALIKHWSLPT